MKTGVAWWDERRFFFRMLRAISDARPECLITTCVVSCDRLPPKGYLEKAAARNLLKADAGPREKMLFWIDQYTMAQNLFRRLDCQLASQNIGQLLATYPDRTHASIAA